MATGRCYLYIGPEIGERGDALIALRKEITKSTGAAPEEQSFYAGETPVSEIVSVLRNASLFADTRLLQLKNTEVIKKKEDLELLCAYIQNPQEDTTLVLISDETSVDKRLDSAVGKERKKIFWELFENRKTEWIASFFRREGFRIEEGAIKAILELVENNTDALRQECSHLTLFLNKEEPVTEQVIETYLAHTREESAFSLFSRIAQGDLSKAIEILRALLAAKQSPQAIIAGLAWCFHKLADYVRLANSGQTTDFELRKIGVSSKRAQTEYSQAARRYTMDSVVHVIALLAEFDILFRSTASGMEETLLDLMLYKIIISPGKALEQPRQA